MTKRLHAATALTAATALVAVPLTIALTAGPAAAVDSNGRCDGARFQLSAEKDDGRIEVEADIDNAPRGSTWRIKLSQDGATFVNVVRVARADDDDDRGGDISIDRSRPNTAGNDVIRMTVNRVGTAGSCTRTITLR